MPDSTISAMAKSFVSIKVLSVLMAGKRAQRRADRHAIIFAPHNRAACRQEGAKLRNLLSSVYPLSDRQIVQASLVSTAAVAYCHYRNKSHDLGCFSEAKARKFSLFEFP